MTKKWYQSTRLAQALLTGIGMLCLTAAVWQYQRAQYHTLLHSDYTTQLSQPYHPITPQELATTKTQFTKIAITLYYDPIDPLFLIDGHTYNSKPGKLLYTLFHTQQSQHAKHNVILVERGWISDADPHFTQHLDKPPEAVTIEGVWKQYHPPINWLLTTITEQFYGSTRTRILPFLDLAYLQRFSKQTILPGILLAQSYHPLTTEKDQAIAPLTTQHIRAIPEPYPPYKNYAYMVQWIIFSLFAFGFVIRTILI